MKPSTLAVLALLRLEGRLGITPAFARERVGTDRLAARIGELRAEGYPIDTVYRTTVSRGRTVRFACYILSELPVPEAVAPGQVDLWPSDGRADASTSAPSRPSERQRTLPRGLVSRLV